MMPFDNAVSYMQTQAQDFTDSGKAYLVMMYNVGYMTLLEEFGNPQIDILSTIDLISGQRNYQMPPDCNRPAFLEFANGTKTYPLIEVADPKRWALFKNGNNQGEPTHFHYRPRFGIGGGILELNPVPGGNDYDLNMTYEAADRELSKVKYTAGSIALTTDSAAVVGTTTAFEIDMVGRYLRTTGSGQDRLPYRITGFTDATHITLENFYAGPGGSTLSYEIIEVPNLPRSMHILPCFFSLEQWWSGKGDATETAKFGAWYRNGLRRAKKVHSNGVRDTIIAADSGMGTPFPQYPSNFPQLLT